MSRLKQTARAVGRFDSFRRRSPRRGHTMYKEVTTDSGIDKLVNKKYSDVGSPGSGLYDQNMGAVMDRFFQSLRIGR